ncbi:MAG: DUF4332 domain-containing protein [Planctomycetota bacterium]
MKINRIATENGWLGQSTSQPLRGEVGPLPPGLSAVIDDGQRQALGLLADALYQTPLAEERPNAGWVELAGRTSKYRLRRQPGGVGAGRFVIETIEGNPIDRQALTQLLGGHDAPLAARVFFSHPGTHDDLATLLSPEVARALQTTDDTAAPEAVPAGWSPESLLSRRDEVTREIERRLADRRKTSEDLEQVVTKLDSEANRLHLRRDELRKTLTGIETDLAEVESRLRYRALAEQAERETADREAADWRPRLDELEQQIEHWRKTLADLEAREAVVRTELSAVHPDDAEPSLPLADQRAGLAVARRLVEDLESEVARLARAAATDACVCRDAHPRLNPLVDTLGKQLGRLAGLAEQQERALHVQSLHAEAAHLARSQDDLRKQLDHLLGRRQALWRTTRARPDETERDANLEVTADQRAALDSRRDELSRELADLDARLEVIATERDSVLARRSTLLSDASLEALQAELDDLHAKLRRPATKTVTTEPAAGRASQWFAKLVDGRFTGLRLVSGGRRVAVLEPGGREHPVETLSQQDQRLAAMALRLAVVGGFARRGIQLPVVLDEPFAGLDDRSAAILTTVLDDFCRLGFQVIVFTDRAVALDRMRAVGAPLLRLSYETPAEAPRPRVEVAPEATPRVVAEVTPPPAKPTLPTARVVRQTIESEYLLAPEDPIERFPVPIANREAVFARSRVRTVGDLMSADPSALAEELDRDDVTAALAALWQTHTGLVCFVPGMSFEVASMISAAGVLSAEDLAEADADELFRLVTDLRRTERGSRYKRVAWSREAAAQWIEAAGRGAERWRSTDIWQSWRRHRGERRERVLRNARRPHDARRDDRDQDDRPSRLRVRRDGEQRDGTRRKRKRRVVSETTTSPAETVLKFRLETTSPVVDAPSIGPKMAERLGGLGITTVAELLEADAEAIASKLGSRISADTVVAWQHQAQLVCRVPMLHGHDAQILVGSGFSQPEEIAAMKPAELLEFVLPFCRSSEGQRALRNSKLPDLAEVTDWIAWSRQCRLLAAA